MMVAQVSACESRLGGCAENIMPGASVVDGADEVVVGNNGLMGTCKAPIAGRARTEIIGMCSLIVRLRFLSWWDEPRGRWRWQG